MRIGIDATCLPLPIGGAGRYIYGLIYSLSNEDKCNEYFVFLKQKDRQFFQNLSPNFHLISVPDYNRPARILWQITRPQKLVQKLNLEVWHAPHYILPRGIEKTYSVVTFHDMTFFLLPKFHTPLKKIFFQKMIQDAVARADEIIAVSKTTLKDIQTIFDCQSKKLSQVYSGTNGIFKPVQNEKVIEWVKLKYDTGEKFVLFVGTLDKRKNLIFLLKSFRNLLDKGHENLSLVLVGQKANGFKELTRAIKSFRLKEQVKIPGYIPDVDLSVLYSAASLFVYLSHYEGFGFPVLEAMACGTPVLTSNLSATKEISELEEMQVAPTDVSICSEKMHQLLIDETLRSKLIQHGLNQYQKFSWENTAKQMIKIYNTAGSKDKQEQGKILTPQSVRQYEIKTKSKPDLQGSEKLGQFPALARSILQTLIYSDLFDYPLKVSEIHEGLIAFCASLLEVKNMLNHSILKNYVEQLDGYYFLKGRAHTIENRKFREHVSFKLLFKNRRLLQIVSHFPFVQATALSGAIAFNNCLPEDDVDLFLIVKPKRIWSVYFFLAIFLKLIGKRNFLCLNYLYAKKNLTVKEKDFFVAHQIANLRPVSGNGVYENFINSNSWIREYLPQTDLSKKSHFYKNFKERLLFNYNQKEPLVKKVLEKILGISIFDKIENWIFAIYGAHIRKITKHLGDSVRVDKDQIKLFTHDHRLKILHDFEQRINTLEEK